MFRKLFKNKKGAALVEYGLLVAGVALMSAAAVSNFGHKTSDLVGAIAAVLPGAHTGDNAPIISGHLIETSTANVGLGATTGLGIDFANIGAYGGTGVAGTARLGANVGDPTMGTTLIIESK